MNGLAKCFVKCSKRPCKQERTMDYCWPLNYISFWSVTDLHLILLLWSPIVNCSWSGQSTHDLTSSSIVSKQSWIVSNCQKKKDHSQHTNYEDFLLVMFVMVEKFNSLNKWTLGELIKRGGGLFQSHVVKLNERRVAHGNVAHVCNCSVKVPNFEQINPDVNLFPNQGSILQQWATLPKDICSESYVLLTDVWILVFNREANVEIELCCLFE